MGRGGRIVRGTLFFGRFSKRVIRSRASLQERQTTTLGIPSADMATGIATLEESLRQVATERRVWVAIAVMAVDTLEATLVNLSRRSYSMD